MKRKSHTRKKTHRKSRRLSGDQSLAPSVIGGIRRHKGKKKSRKRSKVGAMDTVKQNLIGAAIGTAFAFAFDKLGDKFLPNVNSKIKSGVKLAVGLALVVKGKPVLKTAGVVLTASGILSAAKDFGVLQGAEEFMSGIGAGSDTMTIEMNGTPDQAGTFMNGGLNEEIGGEYMSGTSMTMPSVIGNF